MNLDLIKTYLVDQYQVTILNDMTGPTDINFLNGQKVYLLAEQLTISGSELSEEHVAYEISKVLHEGLKSAIAFYEVNERNNKYTIRAATV